MDFDRNAAFSAEKEALGVNRDLLIAFYNSAREELIHRIGQRDQALRLYATFVGVVLGISLAQPQASVILAVLPVVGLAAGVVVTQHHLVIGYLGRYCSGELEKAFTILDVPFPQWDTSEGLIASAPRSMILRLVADAFLVAIPSIFGVIVSEYYAFNPEGIKQLPFHQGWMVGLFWFGILCTVISIGTIVYGAAARIRYYILSGLWRLRPESLGSSKLLTATLMALQVGADGRYSREQLEEELRRRRVDLQSVPLWGAGGLFEESQAEDGTKKCRLSTRGLDLLITHHRIGQIQQRGLTAIWIAIVAMVVAAGSLIWRIAVRS